MAIDTERGDAVTVQCAIVDWPAFPFHAIAEISTKTAKVIIRTPISRLLPEFLVMRGCTTFVHFWQFSTLNFKIPEYRVGFRS